MEKLKFYQFGPKLYNKLIITYPQLPGLMFSINKTPINNIKPINKLNQMPKNPMPNVMPNMNNFNPNNFKQNMMMNNMSNFNQMKNFNNIPQNYQMMNLQGIPMNMVPLNQYNNTLQMRNIPDENKEKNRKSIRYYK